MLQYRSRPLVDGRAQDGLPPLFVVIACAALALAMTLTPSSSKVLLLALAPPIVWLLIRYPEATLALFVTSGLYKGDPRLQAVPVDVTLALAALLVAGILVRGRLAANRSLWEKELLLGLLFAALVFSSLLYAPQTEYGDEKALFFATLTTLAFVAPLFVLGSMEHVKRFFLVLAAVGVALAFSALTGSAPEQRLTAFQSAGTISLARGAGVAVLIILFWLPTFRGSWLWRLAGAGAIVFLLVAQLGTGARGPLFALLGVAGITAFVGLVIGTRSALLPRQAALALMILTLLVGVGVALKSPIVPQQSRERIQEFSLATLEEDPSANSRLEAWDEAGGLFQAHPLVGAGAGSFSVTGIGRFLRYPHNLILEISAEQGLVGLALFTLLLVAVLMRLLSACAAIRRLPGGDITAPLIVLALLLFSLANAMVSGDLNDGRMLWLTLGVALAVVALVRDPQAAREGVAPAAPTQTSPPRSRSEIAT